MAQLTINVSFLLTVEVDDSALTNDKLITQAANQVLDTIGVNFSGVRMLSVDPATLRIGDDVYDLDV
jgi:hypothetical protein